MNLKRIAAVLFTSMFAYGSISSVSACTMIYVGSDVSDDGSSIVARSEDSAKNHNKMFKVHPAEDHAAGAMFTDMTGFTMPLPSHTYRYTLVQDDYTDDGTPDAEGFSEAGYNENGVSLTATVSTSYNASIKAQDKLVGGTGITEESMTAVVLSQATSARNAIEILANVVDTYGAGECNTVMASDQNEVWYMEIVSGHQYAAIKMPTNKVAVIPNMMMLGEIASYPATDVIKSAKLEQTAIDAGTAKYDDQNRFLVAKSYMSGYSSGNTYRVWGGKNLLAPSIISTVDPTPASATGMDLLFSPDKKVGIMDVVNVLGYRYEGTPYATDATGYRAIGADSQMEIHIQQQRKNMPKELAGLQWLAMGNGEFTVYVPYYAQLLTDTHDAYKVTTGNNGRGVATDAVGSKFDENSFYWNFMMVQELSSRNRAMYGSNVKAYWRGYQQKLIEQQKAVDQGMLQLYNTDKSQLSAKATSLGKAVAGEVLGHEKTILKELKAFVDANPSPTTAFVPSLMNGGAVDPSYSFNMDVEPQPQPEPEKPADDTHKTGVPTGDSTNVGALASTFGVTGLAAAVLFLLKRKAA